MPAGKRLPRFTKFNELAFWLPSDYEGITHNSRQYEGVNGPRIS